MRKFYFDWVNFWTIIASLITAIIVGISIWTAALEDDHVKFMENYVGRSFIYKNDTIIVIEYDNNNSRFIVTGAGRIKEDEIYKLIEIKTW